MESIEQKAETPRDKPQEKRLIFSMTKVNTEIILPYYILINWKKVIKMHRKMRKKSLFLVLCTHAHIYTHTHLNALASLEYCVQYQPMIMIPSLPVLRNLHRRGKYNNKNSQVILF